MTKFCKRSILKFYLWLLTTLLICFFSNDLAIAESRLLLLKYFLPGRFRKMSLNCLLSYYIILPSYRVRSQMFPQIVCPNRCIVALVVGYTCVAFLQCEFSNVRSHHLPWQKKTYIGYIWKIFSWKKRRTANTWHLWKELTWLGG